eukprot:88264_1
MYKKNRIDKKKNALPTWLTNDKTKGNVAESKPLVPKLAQSSSYGGQSSGGASNSSSSPVEEDYGESQFGVMGGTAIQDSNDPSWAADAEASNKKNYGTNKIESDHSESSEEDDEDSQDDSGSEDTEEGDDDEESKWHLSERGGSETREKMNKSWPKAKKESKPKKSKKKKKKDNDREALVDDGDDGGADVPRRSCCHSFFILIQIIAILANVALIAFELLPIFIGNLNTLDTVLRGYFSIFSAFFLLAEFELIKTGLNNWMIRGFLYTFLGVIVKEQQIAMLAKGAIPKEYWDGVKTNLLMEVLSWWMIGIGCTYFLFGALCLKVIRDKSREKYQAKLQEYNASDE